MKTATPPACERERRHSGREKRHPKERGLAMRTAVTSLCAVVGQRYTVGGGFGGTDSGGKHIHGKAECELPGG